MQLLDLDSPLSKSPSADATPDITISTTARHKVCQFLNIWLTSVTCPRTPKSLTWRLYTMTHWLIKMDIDTTQLNWEPSFGLQPCTIHIIWSRKYTHRMLTTQETCLFSWVYSQRNLAKKVTLNTQHIERIFNKLCLLCANRCKIDTHVNNNATDTC